MSAITRDMTFNEVLKKFPGTVKVFRSHGMQCAGCLGAEAETIEAGAVAHGVDPEALLAELNQAAGK
jgi:hybrid cluster-associated redox disulfide protein